MLFRQKNKDEEFERRIQELEERLSKESEASQDAERELSMMNQTLHMGLWTVYYDENGEGQVVWSDEFRKMLHVTKEEFPDSMDVLPGYMHPDDIERVFANFGAAQADTSGRTKYDVDYRLKVGGVYKWFHAVGDCIRRKNGSPRIFIGGFHDLTDQKEIAATLERYERRQEITDSMRMEGAWFRDMIATADSKDPEVEYSDRFRELLGFRSISDFPNVMSSWVSRIHPDDIPAAMDGFNRLLEDMRGDCTFDEVYRIKHRDGQWHWYRNTATLSRDKAGVPVMMAGNLLDVTEQKENRERFEREMLPNIEELKEQIAQTLSDVESAAEKMQELADNQAQIAKASESIESSVEESMSITETIQGIASKTNLLSLNASIEAARAGEAGRGFAVVATEVSNLSNSTKDTTNNIAQILSGMTAAVTGVMGKMDETNKNIASQNESMEEIKGTMQRLSALVSDIADMAEKLYQ